MTWARFHYLCRRSHQTLEQDQSIEQCLANIEKEPGTDLYGKADKKNSITHQLLSGIKALNDRARATEILETYGKLDLAPQLNEPLQFKRSIVYLAYVTFIFFITNSIYQLKVNPTFMAAFDVFDIPVPAHLRLYQDYWQYFTLLILALLLVGLITGFTLKNIFKYSASTQQSLRFKYLTLPGIRKAYTNIIDIVFYPLANATPSPSATPSRITEHLRNIESSGMDVKTEMQELIKQEATTLTLLCERQMRFISSLTVIIVIAAIFFFLVSAYSPIFVLGETI